ncbi:hypothetical protein VHEMI01726 [[Torrubiella] hemipterigena]|uniref:Peptidase S53 domain-containing protein n=1 Tax=[Torrubiella] hemipterigena TaxID=1531966 RepID=A0A0A1STV7_9HYPO|nr:hypothetical protein VHEMI01726 [[Torrubiella] hemipterigena]
MAEHVDLIVPGTSMLQMKGDEAPAALPSTARPAYLKPSEKSDVFQSRSAAADPPFPDRVTPSCIKAMYGIPDAPSNPNPNNMIGIYEGNNSFLKLDDLDLFYNNTNVGIPLGHGPIVDYINYYTGKPTGTGYEPEVSLDLHMAYPIIYPQQIHLFNMNNTHCQLYDEFLDAIDGSFCQGDDPSVDTPGGSHVCGAYKPTNVFSFSYSVSEKAWSAPYQTRQCNEWMKLGLQDVSVFHAAGDTGVASPPFGICEGKDNKEIFGPISLVGCPYTTAVGATELPTGKTAGDEEQAAIIHYSGGGGFSDIFPRLDYQNAAVSSFFTNHTPPFPSYNATETGIPDLGSQGLFNRAGRAYPDISADRLAAGKKPVGFVNPALYKNPAMFNDITLGGMLKTRPYTCNNQSFDTAPGWDPVTGLGTPRYPDMSKYFLSL